jgi:hypothetical protein
MSAILSRSVHRRTFRREVMLSCQVVRERDFRLVGSLALDMSTEGMLVLTGERILTGEDMLVSFRAPRTGEWFDLDATVARVLHGRRPGDRGRCLGLSFHRMPESATMSLFENLRGLPAAVPHRPS